MPASATAIAAAMWRAWLPFLLLPAVWAGKYSGDGGLASDASMNAAPQLVPRPPHTAATFEDIVGLEKMKAVLREAVVEASRLTDAEARLFRHSGECSAALLVGPSGLGKGAIIEAAAAAAGAQVISLLATEVAKGFCATVAAAAAGKTTVVIVEALEVAPTAMYVLHQCLRQAGRQSHVDVTRLFFVATLNRALRFLAPAHRVPFGYVAELGMPSTDERKAFLLQLLARISRVDPQWASALPEAAVGSLANLTEGYTFAEVEFGVRRAFLRSTTTGGARDPVALHHFERILAETLPQAVTAFNTSVPESETIVGPEGTAANSGTEKKPQDAKDPIEGIFGWCNAWLPESLHVPPVLWVMIIFGILAYFMARSASHPYGQRRRRGAGGAGGRGNSLFGDSGAVGSPHAPFGEGGFDWYSGGGPFAHLPTPPGMPSMPPMPGMPGSTPDSGQAGEAGTTSSSHAKKQ
eukprot:NODE_5004_length_1821_cov_3.339433.p1 GENE.NODE_5004_length_1821_cov_3.339433~~NODE_5004_length_1821_cov_3.339433.p1  ORF type:complete len:466 (-),score=106.72 NODE_5004_length_1821_cov_3.339433:340-1737(-)